VILHHLPARSLSSAVYGAEDAATAPRSRLAGLEALAARNGISALVLATMAAHGPARAAALAAWPGLATGASAPQWPLPVPAAQWPLYGATAPTLWPCYGP
jgi:hypothetical protein